MLQPAALAHYLALIKNLIRACCSYLPAFFLDFFGVLVVADAAVTYDNEAVSGIRMQSYASYLHFLTVVLGR